MFERILVCLDGSKLAEQILPFAEQQANHFKSQIIFLQAYTIPSAIAAAEAQAAPAGGADLLREEAQRLEAQAMAYLEDTAAPLREKGLNVICVALHGIAGEVIVEYAHKENIGLIALATHGHSGLGRVIFGSVADHVLKKSGLPILIIKPQEI